MPVLGSVMINILPTGYLAGLIKINVSPSGSFISKSKNDAIAALLHELGHVYNFNQAFEGSYILDDSANQPYVSKSNTDNVKDFCSLNQWRSRDNPIDGFIIGGKCAAAKRRPRAF
jgi:hypothetical protein